MKVLLAYLCEYKQRSDYFTSLLPYGLISLASYLETEGYDVILANLSAYGYRKGADYIVREKPDILGVSIYTFNRTESFKLVKEVRKKLPGIKIAAGGPHVSALAEETLLRTRAIDWIVKGEGEHAFHRLLKILEANETPERIIEGERIKDLDTIPAATLFRGKLKGVDIHEQYKYIITSRGCPHSCSYCSSPGFWGRETRFRSAESIYNEIESLYKKYGIIYFSIRDDNFTLNKRRVIELCRMLRENSIHIMWNCQSRVDTIDLEMLVEMKRAGLEHIQYGVESGSERMLGKYDKSISRKQIERAADMTRSAGVYLSVYLMCGMSGETEADTEKTVDMIKRIKPSDGIVSPVAYYPGTYLYDEDKRKGKISDDVWFQSNEPGIFIRNDSFVPRSIERILVALERTGGKGKYGKKDFISHREVTGEDCWVTDIMEGDYFFSIENFRGAESAYKRVVENYPDNIWGHYRMGRLMVSGGKPEKALEYYRAASRAVPGFYGPWLKMAEIHRILDNNQEARNCAHKGLALNSSQSEILRLVKSLEKRD
jgi:anaerobic magnesium-protoporphyrin IX monomethyl ester cyclase